MLPSSRRISRKLFDSGLKTASGFHASHFSLRAWRLQSPDLPSRFSVVVSSAVVRKAHDRNLLKRRARAVIEAALPGLKTGAAGAFFAKKGAGTLPFPELATEIELLLKNARLVIL